MLGFHAVRNVGGHDAARNMRHPASHDAHQLRLGKPVEKRTYGERRFRLAHENAGRDVQRFRSARAHHLGHDPGESANNQLHHADVIEKREDRGDKDDRGKHLERKNKSQRRFLLAQLTKHKLRAKESETQEFIRSLSGVLEDCAANREAQDKECKRQLQAQSPENRLQAYGLAICGKHIRQTQHRGQTQQSSKSSHALTSSCALSLRSSAAQWATRPKCDGPAAAFPVARALRRDSRRKSSSSHPPVWRRYCNELSRAARLFSRGRRCACEIRDPRRDRFCLPFFRGRRRAWRARCRSPRSWSR